MCTAYGDRHYRTFDGLLFDYVGACKVYLVKVIILVTEPEISSGSFGRFCECVSSAPQSSAGVMLSVTAENIDCFDSGVICRKSLLINIGRSFVVFDDDIGEPVRRTVREGHPIKYVKSLQHLRLEV